MIGPEVTQCGCRDVKIQYLTNYQYDGLHNVTDHHQSDSVPFSVMLQIIINLTQSLSV